MVQVFVQLFFNFKSIAWWKGKIHLMAIFFLFINIRSDILVSGFVTPLYLRVRDNFMRIIQDRRLDWMIVNNQ